MAPNVNLGFNGTVKIVDLPAGGAFVNIPPSKAGVRGAIVRESIVSAEGAPLQAQGFQVKVPNDGAGGFTTVFQRPAYSVAGQPGEFPEFRYYNELSEHGPHGELLATYNPPFGGTAYYLQIASLTGTATSVEIWVFC